MMEIKENATMCGVIRYNDTWCEVYCDQYGVLAFDNYSDGTWCLTEVNISDPLELDNTADLVRNVEAGMYGAGCCGVVYSSTGDIVVLISESQAVLRKVWAPTVNEGEPFYYSTDEEYEGQ